MKNRAAQPEKVVFIDRDGVINKDPIGDYIKTWKDFHFLPGVISGLKKLTDTGFQIVIVSNQAGIGDGVFSRKALQDITNKMLGQMKKNGIKVRGIFYCLHGKKAGCNCRKPETGLFEQAAKEVSFDRQETYFIGDKISDVEAGKRFGLKTMFVLTGHGQSHMKKLMRHSMPDLIVQDFSEAVIELLNEEPRFS